MATVIISNLPLLYPGMGPGFLSMLISTGLRTELYPYALMLFVTILVLSLVYHEEVSSAYREFRAKNRTAESTENGQVVVTPLS